MTGSRVMITGLGMTTPIGHDVASSWAAFMQGRSGVREMEDPVYAGLPVRIAAPAAQEPEEVTGRVERRRWDRSQQLAVVAARQAWADAGFKGTAPECGLDPERVGVVVGSGIGGILSILARYDVFRDRGWTSIPPYGITMAMPNGAAAVVSFEVGARGRLHAPTSACATGAEAIGQAVQIIRSGWADVVVAGGTEAAIHPFALAGFAAMRALSKRNGEPARASRPFDAARDGFVLGEGAGILVLESEAHATARGAPAYGEAVGVGYSGDTYHLVRADPDGSGPALAMRRAVADAAAVLGQDMGATLGQVVHVNAHATSTPNGDAAEAHAIREVLGEWPVVTSTKSMTGHLLGAAGAVEAIAAILAARDGVAPPTINLDEQDPDVMLDIAVGKPRQLPTLRDGQCPLVLSNSFGFGGHNVTLVFRQSRTRCGQAAAFRSGPAAQAAGPAPRGRGLPWPEVLTEPNASRGLQSYRLRDPRYRPCARWTRSSGIAAQPRRRRLGPNRCHGRDRNSTVKVRINSERCQGHGRCYDLAPGLFGEDEEGYGVVLGEGDVPPGAEQDARRAVSNCPERAIEVPGET